MSVSAASAGPVERRLEHHPHCFGCGPENLGGLGLDIRWTGSEATVSLVPPADSAGAPGIVHGGYLSAIADEVMVLAASADELPAVTRRVEVDYRAPVMAEKRLEMRARVTRTRGRRVYTALRAGSPGDENPSLEARGVYVKIPAEAWIVRLAPRDPSTGTIDLGATDPTSYFRLQTQVLTRVFDPARLARPVRVALELSDVEPSSWCLSATSRGLHVRPGACTRYHARFAGELPTWERLLYDPTLLDDAVTAGAVEGERDALAHLFGCLSLAV
ncbi:MAG TPA: hotdog domain-containing protein [Thermoleophilaceae bacterium]